MIQKALTICDIFPCRVTNGQSQVPQKTKYKIQMAEALNERKQERLNYNALFCIGLEDFLFFKTYFLNHQG